MDDEYPAGFCREGRHVRDGIPDAADCETTIMGTQSNILLRLFNNHDGCNAALKVWVREAILKKFSDTGLKVSIEKELNETERFVFPGGGTFEMKDPTINLKGHLLVGWAQRHTVIRTAISTGFTSFCSSY